MRFPARHGQVATFGLSSKPTEASARPGGREAPAMGGAGAGRVHEAPGWMADISARGKGDGLCQSDVPHASDSATFMSVT